MRVPRTQVSSALFSLLQNAYPWQTAAPRMQVPDNLPANMQPAMFLVKPREMISQNESFQLPIYRLKYFVLVMLRASATPEDADNTAEVQLDNIIDAIEAALMPKLGQKQTLGGLVSHTWMDGDIAIDTPVLFEQTAIWIPITVLVGG